MPCMGTRAQQAPSRHLLIACCSLLVPGISWGFGADAHRIVGYIANEYMRDCSRAAVSEILEGESLSEAGLWADQIRGNREWNYVRPWHFINIPDGIAMQDAQRSAGGDVLWAINEMNRRLDDPDLGDEARAKALKLLIHFVADVHQPLHVGYFEDRGGNRVRVTYFRKPGKPPGKSNLHAYWDTKALQVSLEDWESGARGLIAGIEEEGVPESLGQAEDWVAEAIDYRPEVYDFDDFNRGRSVYLGNDYLTSARQILRAQLSLAGLRLAATLNERYCPGPTAESPE